MVSRQDLEVKQAGGGQHKLDEPTLNVATNNSVYFEKHAPVFNETTAVEFLTHIRLGLTIREACRKKGMPEHLTIYDWLHDPSLKIGKRSFESHFRDALQDRNLSWLDDALLDLKGLNLSGTREDAARLRKAEIVSNMYLKIATQGKQLTRIGADSGTDKEITVNIQMFGIPQEDL